MSTTQYTLQDTLAIAAITKSIGLVRPTTAKAIKPYLRELKTGGVKLNPEGRELAQRSRLMKAHQFLTKEGFAPVVEDVQKSAFQYRSISGNKMAVMDARGRVLMDKKELQFRNGDNDEPVTIN